MTPARSQPVTRSPDATRWRVPFHVADIDDGDVAAVVEVLRSGWLTTGQRAREFERRFAARIGDDVQAVAVSSGTAALHLGIEAVGVRRGDLVITSPYTFTATAEVIRHAGADPVFADVDPVTGNLTLETVLAAYEGLRSEDRARVRAVMPVHFAGRPCDMTGLSALADPHGWRVVDDAAHALPAAHRQRPIGASGDVTAFSFYATKTLCTGEGGMAVTRDADLAARMRLMRLHGIDRDAFDRYRRADSWYYEVVEAGFKYNLPDTAAALGLSQLTRLAEHRERRASIAAAYTSAFAAVDGLAPPTAVAAGDSHAWHLYPLRVEAGEAVRNELIRQLAAVGVGSSVHFIPLHLQPYYRDRYRLSPDDFPGASQLYVQEISLPIFPGMTDRQVAIVIEDVRDGLEQALPAVERTPA